MSDFTTALKQFVHRETDENLKQVRSMWAESVEKRVSEGEAVADLVPLEVKPHRGRFQFQRNLSKFRPGDELLLNRGVPFDRPNIPCVLEEEDDSTITLTPGYQQTFLGLEAGNWVLDRNVVDIRQIQIAVLNELEAQPDMLRLYTNYLDGKVQPNIDAATYQSELKRAREIGMNASQADGFAHALATRNYYLIQGPPGTGKTWVLAHLAAELARRGERVFVTGFTHRAINNALRKIATATQYKDVIKIGQHLQADDLGSVKNFESFDQTGLNPQGRGFIVGGTCFAVRGKKLNMVKFDTVIFDEAGQVTLPLAFAGMLSAARSVFIGDHQQMPPVIVAEHEPDWVTKSIFERLYQNGRSTMLDTTYRMNQEINAFPSRVFYGGCLKTADANRHRRLKLTQRSSSLAGQLLNPDAPEVFAAIPHIGKGMRSAEEAILAAHLICEALAGGVKPSEIAVVTPYRAQVRLIRQEVRRLIPNVRQISDIVVDTVERIQGQERELIVISLVTSDPAHASNRASFYFMPNRLNVAITRPSLKRIILGSPHLFKTDVSDPKHRQWVELFREFYQSSNVVHVKLDDVYNLTPSN